MKDDKRLIALTTGTWARLVMVIAITFALYKVRHIILVIITSIVIASAIEPAAVWARKRNIPRLPTVIAVYVISALTFAGLFYFLLLPLLGDAADFVRTLPNYSSSFNSSTVLGDFGSTFSLETIVSYLNDIVASVSAGAFSSVSRIFGGVASFVIIIVLSFYLAVQEDGIGKFLRIVTPSHHEKYVVGLWRRSQHKIGLWMQGQVLLAVIVVVLVYLGLMLVGIPHALLLAVLAGFFEIIPLFGPILSAIPGIFVAYSTSGASVALITAGLYLIIQQFENHLVYPLVVRKVVGVPPMVSIVALLIGGQLAGFLGILISVPLATVVTELFGDLESHKISRQAAHEGQ